MRKWAETFACHIDLGMGSSATSGTGASLNQRDIRYGWQDNPVFANALLHEMFGSGTGSGGGGFSGGGSGGGSNPIDWNDPWGTGRGDAGFSDPFPGEHVGDNTAVDPNAPDYSGKNPNVGYPGYAGGGPPGLGQPPPLDQTGSGHGPGHGGANGGAIAYNQTPIGIGARGGAPATGNGGPRLMGMNAFSPGTNDPPAPMNPAEAAYLQNTGHMAASPSSVAQSNFSGAGGIDMTPNPGMAGRTAFIGANHTFVRYDQNGVPQVIENPGASALNPNPGTAQYGHGGIRPQSTSMYGDPGGGDGGGALPGTTRKGSGPTSHHPQPPTQLPADWNAPPAAITGLPRGAPPGARAVGSQYPPGSYSIGQTVYNSSGRAIGGIINAGSSFSGQSPYVGSNPTRAEAAATPPNYVPPGPQLAHPPSNNGGTPPPSGDTSYQWGTGGASGNRGAVGSSLWNQFSNMADPRNNLDPQFAQSLREEGMDATRAGYAGARGQMGRRVAATGNSAGYAAGMSQLGRSEAGAYGQQGRQNVLALEQERQRRRELGLQGLQGLYGGENSYNLGLLGMGTNMMNLPTQTTNRSKTAQGSDSSNFNFGINL